MKNSLQHSEIVLVSSGQANVKWILDTLRIAGLENELIWIRDFQRARDYFGAKGLYSGQSLGECPKVYIIDETFLQKAEVIQMIESLKCSTDYRIMSLEDSREEFQSLRKTSSNPSFLGKNLPNLTMFSFSLI